ncbi:MAG: translation initiation factor IF-2 subunit alpha [Candidatus Methanomethylicia archaeon]|nr:translation initiation factor IF-2 subunit alpha [Candidatus Methanomethylicia archaeon]
MVLRKKDYPEIGEYVIATAVKLMEHGVYVSIDEYEKNGYIPIGEVASTWVKNIKDFVKEGQKLVLKVIRIDEKKGHIDCSLRKVTEREKKEKLIQYKKLKKAEKLLESASKALGKSYAEGVKVAGIPLEDHYGDLYSALESASSRGPKALLEAGMPEDWASAIYEASKGHIETPVVSVAGVIKLTSNNPRGVEEIKDSIMKGIKESASKEAKVTITYLGSPNYRIEVTAKDYKAAEDQMKKTADVILARLEKAGGKGEFTR